MNKLIVIGHNINCLKEIKSIVKDTFLNSNILLINDYQNLTNELIISKNKKIYIIEENRTKSFFETLEKIRKYDWESIIIILTKKRKVSYDKSLMIFSYIYLDENYLDNISKTINKTIAIIENKDTYVFSYKHSIYRIFFNDINYIEKESNIKRCIIHTINKTYYITKSITKLEQELGHMFIKTHQSGIINFSNIKLITKDFVQFYNGDKTNLINKDMRNNILKLLEKEV